MAHLGEARYLVRICSNLKVAIVQDVLLVGIQLFMLQLLHKNNNWYYFEPSSRIPLPCHVKSFRLP